MKGQSDKLPERIEKIGDRVQIRWNITQRTIDFDAKSITVYEYDYANCDSDSYEKLVSGIIRSRYNADQMEAIILNFSKKVDIEEYLRLQAFRNLAKHIASGNNTYTESAVKVTMPLAFALAGGKYESLADRVLKINSPHEIIHDENENEIVIVYLKYIIEDHYNFLVADTEVDIQEIDLIHE